MTGGRNIKVSAALASDESEAVASRLDSNRVLTKAADHLGIVLRSPGKRT